MDDKNRLEENEVKMQKGKFSRWLENYLYHYKWHTIAVAFVVIVVVICTLQMCDKTSYDMLIVYAGNKDIERTSTNGGTPEYADVSGAFKNVIDDYDENGELSVSLKTMFWMSSNEIKAWNEANNNKEIEDREELNTLLIQNNHTEITDLITYSEYYLWFMSDDLYNDIMSKSPDRFMPLDSLVPEGKEVSYCGDGTYAIYLSSTAFYDLPGVKNLPSDTVIVLRRLGVGTNKSTEKSYENSIKVIKNILRFE